MAFLFWGHHPLSSQVVDNLKSVSPFWQPIDSIAILHHLSHHRHQHHHLSHHLNQHHHHMDIIMARWVIYDSYVAYETAKELAEEREMKKEAKDIKVTTISSSKKLKTLEWNFCQTWVNRLNRWRRWGNGCLRLLKRAGMRRSFSSSTFFNTSHITRWTRRCWGRPRSWRGWWTRTPTMRSPKVSTPAFLHCAKGFQFYENRVKYKRLEF